MMPATKSLLNRFLFVGTGVVLTLCLFRLWIAAYPDPGDPKNLSYILWKHGLNSEMDLNTALVTMTHDTWAVNRVRGLTPDQLKKRFGYVKTYEEARPYLQLCATPNAVGELGNSPHEHNVLYLRDEDWMVILKNGRAVDLVLCKGY